MSSRKIFPTMYESLHPSFSTHPNERNDNTKNTFQIIPTAKCFFEEVIERIHQAHSTVDLQFYTLEADHEVRRILDASMTAARRGVVIRILGDHLVSDPRRLLATLKMNQRMNSLPNMKIKRLRIAEGLANLAVRNHKKIVAVDANDDMGRAYIGGVNLAARSLRWNDFMVRIQGPIAHHIHQDFSESWEGENKYAKNIAHENDQETRLLTDVGRKGEIVNFALKSIFQAKQRVWLETPYLDVKNIGTALCLAKKENPALDVRVIIPRFNNYPNDRLRFRNICNLLRNAGVSVNPYGKSFRRLNHAKMLLVDNLAVFGSSNFSNQPMAGKNTEIAIATKNPDLVEQLQRWYQEDLKECLD